VEVSVGHTLSMRPWGIFHQARETRGVPHQ